MVRLLMAAAIVAFFGLGRPSIAAAEGSNMYNAPQGISNTELLRWIYNSPFPPACPDAAQFVRDLRDKPVSDPATMHKGMRIFVACGNSPKGQAYVGLRNVATYATAAAALMAARHESNPDALRDVNLARSYATDVQSFTTSGTVENPSAFRTNSTRILNDANALLAAIKASGGSSATTHSMSSSAPASTSSPNGTH